MEGRIGMLRSTALMAMIVGVLAPASADATGCHEWNRMSESQQRDRIDRMIADALSSQRGRSYNVNRAAIARCLEDNSDSMFYDFGDLCGDSRTARKSAIRTRFKNYIWTCVNR
jgi:hypothetical protein